MRLDQFAALRLADLSAKSPRRGPVATARSRFTCCAAHQGAKRESSSQVAACLRATVVAAA